MNVFNLNKNITKELENIVAYRKRLQQCSVSIDQLSTEKEREINIRIKEIQSEILGPTSQTLMKIREQLLNPKTKNVVPEGKTLDCFDAQIRNEVSSRLEGLDSKISQIEHDIQEAQAVVSLTRLRVNIPSIVTSQPPQANISQAVVPSFKKAQTIPELQQQYANALAELLTYQQTLTSNSKQYKQTAKLVQSLEKACQTITKRAESNKCSIKQKSMQNYINRAEYFTLAISLIQNGYADAHDWVVELGKNGKIKNAWFLLKVHEALSATCMLDLIDLKAKAQGDNGIELLEQVLQNARAQIVNREQPEKKAIINAASQSSDTPAGVLPFAKAGTVSELQKQYADIQEELSAYQKTLTSISKQFNQTTNLLNILDSARTMVDEYAIKSYKIDHKFMKDYVKRAEYFALAVQLIKRGYTGAYSWVGELDKNDKIDNAWVLLDVHDRLPSIGKTGRSELKRRAMEEDGAEQLRALLSSTSAEPIRSQLSVSERQEPLIVLPRTYEYSQALFFGEKNSSNSSNLGSEKTKGDDHGTQSHHPMSLYKIN